MSIYGIGKTNIRLYASALPAVPLIHINIEMRIVNVFYYLTLLLFVLPVLVLAQKETEKGAIIKFEKNSHNFDRIEEYGGTVSVDFKFSNKGDEPLFLKNVEASCGCTIPEWTKDTLQSGETGLIKVSYNPINRPGPFNKTITVTSNSTTAVSVLTIEGMVRPKPGDLSKQYPVKVGGLSFRKRNIQFGNITNEKAVAKSIEAYNSTDQAITFSEGYHSPDHISVSFDPKVIHPGQVGLIEIIYDAQKGGLGYRSDNVTLFTQEQQDSIKQFNIYATVLEHFPPVNIKDLASLPKIATDKKIHDFGNTTPNEVLNTEFLITNNGKEPLVLKKIQTNCNCVQVKYDKKIVLQGDSARLLVKFEIPDLAVGTQQKDISIFTNDPSNHVQVLTVKAYVRD